MSQSSSGSGFWAKAKDFLGVEVKVDENGNQYLDFPGTPKFVDTMADRVAEAVFKFFQLLVTDPVDATGDAMKQLASMIATAIRLVFWLVKYAFVFGLSLGFMSGVVLTALLTLVIIPWLF